jgi:NADH-quinone oxidoreductase subunit F
MERISSVEDFIHFRQLILDEPEDDKPCIVISAGTCGQASGANDIIRITKRHILEQNLHDQISLRITGCLGFCEMEPFLLVEPGNIIYPKPEMEDMTRIIDATVEGNIIEEMVYSENGGQKKYHSMQEIPFFKNQTRTILGKNQKLDPLRILDYLRAGGYAAFEKVISNLDPDWIINEITKAGLRGRGGAGFPAGRKWESARRAGNGSTKKFVVCNADEGDPGAYMDRSLLEGNPHAIIEGMIIAGMAIGAGQGYIYVRREYPLAIKHTLIALRQARDIGILGKGIMGTSIDFDIEIIRGAGAFVCGEETALIRSIEGKIGQPEQRPPYPVANGIWGCPTCINNVETLANVTVIISDGADKYTKVGMPGNRGTKIFSLVGKIRNSGLAEVPFGTTIREVVYNIGGGPRDNKKIKAVQTGGPSGGCIPENMFDLPIDYESLTAAGSIMGSGGMIVMDEDTCMVDIARYYTNFLKGESCGKCSTCREGIQRMNEILTNITEGGGNIEDLALLEELGKVIKDASLCGLGQTAPNPVLSTLRYFRDEYIAHIKHKKCLPGACKEIVSSPCQHICPIETEVPVYIAHIARGEFEEALDVIRKDNPLPSICSRVCHHPCESKCRSGEGGEPIAIRSLKRFVTDYGIKSGKFQKKKLKSSVNQKKIAIIGSGPAGLTAGYCLAQKGHNVTIFESLPVVGGMLRVGIPEYRLPREILDFDIQAIKDSGLTIKTNLTIGKDISIDELFKKGYKAILITIGAHKPLKLGIPDEDVDGVIPSMQFLKSKNLGRKAGIGKRVPVPVRIGIIGGGNSAVDAARIAIRQKECEEVTIIYRRTRAEMPAFKEEIEGAIKEGIGFHFLASPTKIITKDEKLTGVECIRMELGDIDKSGRRLPVPVKGSEFTIDMDAMVVAIGEQPDASFLGKHIEISKQNRIVVDTETLATNREGIFAGGDAVTGSNTVVDAIATGKLACESIDKFLKGESLKRQYEVTRPSTYIEPVELTDEEIAQAKRPEMPKLSLKQRVNNFKEIELGFTEEMAVKEARRCLRCDLETKEGKKQFAEV